MPRGFSVDYGADQKDPNFSKLGKFEHHPDGLYQWQVGQRGKVELLIVQNLSEQNLSGPRTTTRVKSTRIG